MFTPSRSDVRAFFAEAARKRAAGEVATPLETLAADWADAHPEYAADLARGEAPATEPAPETEPEPEPEPEPADGGRENPFLHLSMHLAISEQLQIDRPAGLRAAFERLASRRGSAHAAQHEIMECLGEALWRSQRNGTPMDSDAYLDCVRRRASA